MARTSASALSGSLCRDGAMKGGMWGMGLIVQRTLPSLPRPPSA
jgi:hypothetical protein